MPGRKKKVNPTEPCRRCGGMCENPIYATGSLPVGANGEIEKIDKVVICDDCMVLGMRNPSEFWGKGWD